MAYVNVAEWKTEQVCEWLKGLYNSVLPYVHSFTNNKVNGQQLLSLRSEDLEQLGVIKLGHQEIILEAVEYLRNFHYELDRENLQLLALRLSCQAHSLHNELSRQTDSKPVTTQTLSDVVAVVTAVKPLVRWLDRPPFSGQLEYNDKKTELLKLSIEMATCAQRDRFAEKPIEEIRTTCEALAKLADYIIQDISDPMILQPSSLDLATLKKRPGDDLGFLILPSFHGTHQIAEIKFGSVAHQCGKMEDGDEIVQVNYQTVVGWERKNVLELFNESPAEVLLTLKRRPRHTKVYGQIYIKPYRLPSNKKTPYATRWQHNLPSPRPELLTIPDFTMPLPRHTPKDPTPEPARIIDTVCMLDPMVTDSSDSDSEVEPPLSVRLYASKPRSLVQRRATITGASPTTKHAADIEEFWKELKQEHSTTFQLRDKAASCAHGLDSVPSNHRPQTCLGIEQTKRKKKLEESFDEKKVQLLEKLIEVSPENPKPNETLSNFSITSNTSENHKTGGGNDIVIRNDGNNCCDTSVTSKKCDVNSGNNICLNDKEFGIRCRKERGKLDKSHSTPAYDLTETTPVEILDVPNNSKIIVASNYSPSINVAKTEINISTKNFDENKNSKIINEKESKMEGNVAQKINFIEEKFRENGNEAKVIISKVPEINDLTRKVQVEVNELTMKIDSSEDQSTNDSIHSVEINKIADDKHEPKIQNEQSVVHKSSDIYALSRESSEEKSESTSSYKEGIYSSSSEADAPPVKFERIPSLVLTEKNKTTDANVALIDSIKVPNKILTKLDSKENLSPQFTTSPPTVLRRENRHEELQDRKDSPPQSRSPAELKDGPKKMESKSRLTPPEPPPRKYFTKPSPLNLNLGNIAPDPPERPRVPDRLDVRKEIRKPVGISPENRSILETNTHRECFEGYRDFVEKSTDFIDEPSTPVHERKTSIDHFGYSEIYERQLKDEIKLASEKYEPFTDKFGNGNCSTVQCQPEIIPRSADSPDGAGCSRQTPESKPRTLEKDKHAEKGVVNRAMMVARSIGLHGSSKVSSSSPRSSRKRNMLLAKRRNVSVKDIGQGELEGWLTYRSRGAGGAWGRSWFILKGPSLYRFKNQDAQKSDCLIALPGFTASQATEVKSRKFAFKVYHTGIAFYFAADTDDSLVVWLDCINKVTLGADSHNRTSGLFSETDESDSESKTLGKGKGSLTQDCKSTTFGSLKKLGRKDSGAKDHDIGGASLDRKYLRFLGARTQNVPVPTAQFRSYRRVLPSSTPNRKPESPSNSPDLRVTVAGSTFYGLTSSHSATDVPTSTHDMGDYRQTTDRSQSSRSRRPDDLRGFVTLEEFMLSHQSEDPQRVISNRSSSPRQRNTQPGNDHVHSQHRHHEDNNNGIVYGQTRQFTNEFTSNGMIYGHPRNGEETSPMNNNKPTSGYGFNRTPEERSAADQRFVESIYAHRIDGDPNISSVRPDESNERRSPHERSTTSPRNLRESTSCFSRRIQEGAVYYSPRQNDSTHWQNVPYGGKQEARSRLAELSQSRDPHGLASRIYARGDNLSDSRVSTFKRDEIPQPAPRRFIRDNGYSGSSGDLTCYTGSETLQRARKEASVSRKGSFNLSDRRKDSIPEKHWMDSLRRSDKKTNAAQKARLKTVAQYQPPPIPSSPFEQDGMRAAFEMHLDKGEHVQAKTSRLKSLFGSRSPQKPSTLDLPKESQKTLLGSPRLHRALFRDKSSSLKQTTGRSGSQSPGDSGISQSLSSYSGISQSQTFSQSFSSVSSASDWSPDGSNMNSGKCIMGHSTCQKRPSIASNRNLMNPPTLPYIPPPTSPPPDDYPGLEYPPVFEPGTYSLSDASSFRTKSKKSQNDNEE